MFFCAVISQSLLSPDKANSVPTTIGCVISKRNCCGSEADSNAEVCAERKFAIWSLWFARLAWISCEIWRRDVSETEREREWEACDTLHRTLMRGREPKELGNEIRCNSIQLLLSRHGWRFKTHPVKIRFTDEEEDCSSHSAALCYAATASHSQQLWFISTHGASLGSVGIW